ncbi:response regulator receiver domain [Chloroflexota bacterium]
MIECEFVKQSREIVENFLQSVVVVDDYGQLDKLNESPEPAPSEELKSPPERPTIGASKSSVTITKEEPMKDDKKETADEETNKEEDRFNAKQVIDSFADKGITCAVLTPIGQKDLDNLANTISKLALTSDVLIFDWALGDTGGRTRNLIQNLVCPDEKNKDRLRLIVIYTIENRILDILNEIFSEIKKIPEGPKVEKNEAEYSLITSSAKIIVTLKQAAKVPPEAKELLERKVPFDKLADCVIGEFTEMTHGLVPNVALQSIAEIRDNTSKLLTRFNRELDAPYLTHRTLLVNPEEAEEHLVALIAEELVSILEEKDVKAKASIETIKHWIDYIKPENDNFTLKIEGGESKNWTKAQVIELLDKGIDIINEGKHTIGQGSFVKNARNSNLSRMYYCSDADNLNLDHKFAVLSTLRSFYGKPIPKLNLGTIIKTVDGTEEYYICIQPRCDCVRIDTSRKFLFLPLVNADGDVFDLVINHGDQFLKFKIKNSSYDVLPLDFSGDAAWKGRIFSRFQDEAYFFKDMANKSYKWIGEMKIEHALSLSSVYSAELSRVGPNESEWLRRSKVK